jgi:RNA polymerase sigma factor (sigma-70 family)
VLRDRDDAADATHDTFLIAAQRLSQLREPAKLRAWLYAIARHEALRRARARSRVYVADVQDLDAIASTSAAPEETVQQAETVAAVWEAAGGLGARDRALLDLHLRQGLQGPELAAAIGVSAHHADVLMSRLRHQVERALGALLVARYGRNDCPELQTVLSEWDGTYSPIWRKRVSRHVDGCDLCTRRRATFLQPLAAFAAVGLVAAPTALRERTLSDVASASTDPHPPKGWRGRGAGDGFPPSAYPDTVRRRFTGALAAVTLMAAAVVLVVATATQTGPEPANTTKTPPAGPTPPSTVASVLGSNPTHAAVTTTAPTTPTTRRPASTTPTTRLPASTTQTSRLPASNTTTSTTRVPPTSRPPLR